MQEMSMRECMEAAEKARRRASAAQSYFERSRFEAEAEEYEAEFHERCEEKERYERMYEST